jgi:hypothetical protein
VKPGEYLMFGFDDGAPSDFLDPQVVRSLLPKGQPLTIAEQNAEPVKLRLPAKIR